MTTNNRLCEALETIRQIVADAQDGRDRFAYIASTIRINALYAGASTEEAEAMVRGHKPFIEWLAKQYETKRKAALAAAPQPASDYRCKLCREHGEPHGYGCMEPGCGKPPPEREALVEMIRHVGWVEAQSPEAIADALLARGLRLPGGEARNRVEYDDTGKLDEVVTDAGMHLERMSDDGWYLSGQRSDGSEIAIWLKGEVTLAEERPTIRVVEGGDE